MKVVSMQTLFKFFATDGDKINEVKATSFAYTGFNNMVGNKYEFNLKIMTTAKYKNIFLTVETNGTYLYDCEDYFEDENMEFTKENITEWLNAILA